LKPGSPRAALADRADFTQDYPTDIVACVDCGLLLRNPRLSPGEIERLYAQDRYGPQRLSELQEAQLKLYRPKARFLKHGLAPGSRVVEVGSFVGGFLRAGQEQGWRMLGVDPGEEVDQFCREQGLPVFKGTLEQAPIPENSVDALVIWNTFDQIPDPHPLLVQARRIVKPGGLLAVRVPNGACFRTCAGWIHRLRHSSLLGRGLLGPLLAAMAWNNLLAFPYLYGYTLPSLSRLMARYGLVMTSASGETLCQLADEQTRGWAAWEERGIKRLQKGLAWAEGSFFKNHLTLAPWMDIYFCRETNLEGK
jgi:SAM-dependent methyltransferase